MSRWRVDVVNQEADRIINEALLKGSNIHYGIETLLNDGVVIYNNPLHPLKQDNIIKLRKKVERVYEVQSQVVHTEIWRIYTWLKTLNAKEIKSEMTVFSARDLYAGTLDARIKVPESGEYMIAGSSPMKVEAGTYLCDWKTGKSIDTIDYYHQLSAYCKAYEEGNYGDKIDGAFLVHSNARTKSGIEGLQTKFLSMEEVYQYYEQFKAIHKVYLIHNPIPKPTVLEFPEHLTLKDLPKEIKGLFNEQ